MRRIALLLLAGALLSPLQAPAEDDAPRDAERRAAHQEFRRAFDAGAYEAALPLALRVIDLTRDQYGEQALELATPLTNLATTFYRMEQLGEALGPYRRALALLDEHAAPADARRVAPLQGMAAVLRGMERHEEAIQLLERLIELIRVREGLDSPAQFPALHALIEEHEKTGRFDEAVQLRLHAFDTAERAYGADDVQMVGPLGELARWYEDTQRFSGARVLYLRAVQVADQHDAGGLTAVEPLEALARTFRKKRLFNEGNIATTLAELPRSVVRARIANFMAAPPDEGERALEDALQRLEKAGPEHALRRGELLVELGDLRRVMGDRRHAIETWTEAWQQLNLAGDTRLLDQPDAVDIPRLRVSPGLVPIRVVLRVSVTSLGEVSDVALVESGDTRRNVSALQRRLKDSIWRPAFIGGQAVNAHIFHSDYIHVPRIKPPDNQAAP